MWLYSLLLNSNTELTAADFIQSIEDQAGIKTIKFEVDQVEVDSLEAVFKFDTAEIQNVKVHAEDMSGNIAEASFSLKVIGAYLAYVEDFADIKTIQEITPDWLSGITKNDKIIEVVADADEVDINTPGEYLLTYYINGDDNEKVIAKTVTVTVKNPKRTTAVTKKGGTIKPEKPSNNNASTSKTDSKSVKDAQARVVAKEIIASIPSGTDLERIKAAGEAVLEYTCEAEYMMTGEDYNLPYGVFIAGEYSFAGTARALGLLLEMMGYQWEHINPNQYTHQWVTVKNMDGKVGWADGQVGLAGYGEYPFEGAQYIYQPYEGSDWEPVSFVGE